MIKTDISVPIIYSSEDIKDAVCAHLPIDKSEINEVKIFKKSLKVDKEKRFNLSVGISLGSEREAGLLKMKKKVSEAPCYDFDVSERRLDSNPIVVGAGPSGLFAALILAEAGTCPIVLERGDEVEKRKEKVGGFFIHKELDPESNIQFGEGGAGAFSDGKLKVGSMDKYKYKVLTEFVNQGAPEDILYTVGAHLGTDKLPGYVKGIREKIISLGGKFIYRAKVSDINVKDGKICGVVYDKDGKKATIDATRVIFATGHSAKDTFSLLLSRGVKMIPKGFGIGVRVEHKREYINDLILGTKTPESEIGTASYHLVTHLKGGRSVYSFCMCPGGTVVAAASESCGVVTNGMSEEARMADNSNAAHLVSVTTEDFGSDHPLAGIDLQRRLESLAFQVAGKDYSAPASRMDNFMNSYGNDKFGDVIPSYPCGVSNVSLNKFLPPYITDSLKAGIKDFDDYIPGFYTGDAVLTGVETRSTSPVKILRNDLYMVESVRGLYPIGEGAGYAGGIISSAVDGVRCAESILINE